MSSPFPQPHASEGTGDVRRSPVPWECPPPTSAAEKSPPPALSWEGEREENASASAVALFGGSGAVCIEREREIEREMTGGDEKKVVATASLPPALSASKGHEDR